MELNESGPNPAENIETINRRPLDGLTLKKLIEAGLSWLRTNQQTVNALNVFPVPDGDTGTNMVLTMQAALDEISNSSERNFGKMAHAVAQGALMGARGNSGVILSQLWRGFARSVDNQETLNAANLAQAFASARDTAYKGVVRPVEGTILTVAKDIATEANEALNDNTDPVAMLKRVVEAADLSVQRTPDLLPVLKDAGVVDSGGKGLFYILEGMLRFIQGQSLETPLSYVQPLSSIKIDETMTMVEPGQDYELVIDFYPQGKLDLEGFYKHLEEIGTSIQLGEGDGMYRLHIHVPTENKYVPIEYIESFATMQKVTIENLLAQLEQIQNQEKDSQINLTPIEPGQIAVIAVAPGKGIGRVFASLGVANLVAGGQTMNPSTQEILNAFENLPTDKIVLLPNNKNIIGAAENAAELTVKKVAVIPSKTIPQGLASMLRLSPHGNFDEVVQEMIAALDEVESGEITQATRSVEINGVSVKEGEFIALLNNKLVYASSSLEATCLGLLEHGHAEHFELITMFYGMEMEPSVVTQIEDAVRRAYPMHEIEIKDGGQPHYHFIISLE